MRTTILLLMTIFMTSGCMSNNAQRSAGIGSLAGATVGALTFNNKITGAAVGAGAGLLVGYIVGNEMDKADRMHVSQTLESTPSGSVEHWKNPDTGVYYEAEPRPARYERNRHFREVELRATMPDGRRETILADAYRGPDGNWHLVQ